MNPTALSQISFAQAQYEKKKKRTRREVFLEKMEQVVPWSRLMEVIEPYYPKSGKRGRPPIGLERMQRMYFVQQWYGLTDEAVQDAVYDSQALRNFMGIDLSRTSVPDATTLMGWRHLDCGAQFNEKQRACTGSRNAPDQERQPVALRLESAYWRGQGLRSGAHAEQDGGQRQRH